jgi:hypothetical protein
MEDTGTLTPSATTPTSPAAPATSAPSESSLPGPRPTMAQAFAANAALTPETGSAPQGEASIQPAEPAPDGSAPLPSTSTKPQGPIPFEVHHKALENARQKAAAEAQAVFDRDYGWARQIPQQTVQQWSGIANLMASDPPAFLERYFSEAAMHPTFGPQVKSWAAKTLARRADIPADLSPDVVVQDADGREVARTFSADRVQAVLKARDKEFTDRELAPLKQDLEARKAQAEQWQRAQQQAEATKRLEASTDAVLADISELLDIGSETAPAERDALFGELTALLDADPQLSPHKAAMQLRKTRIVPALQGQVQRQVLDELNQKAGAQGMNPSRASNAPAHKPRSFNDPSLKW